MSNDNRLQRIFRSIDWIEENSYEEITNPAKKMAEISCFSDYHYNRIFQAMTGTSPGLYFKRRQLTQAANTLQQTSQTIIDIALQYGYGSQEAFSRAFKDMFHCTPAQCRKENRDLSALYQNAILYNDIKHISEGGITLTPTIKHHDSLMIYGVQQSIKFDDYAAANDVWIDYLKDKNREAVYYGVCSGTIFRGQQQLFLSYLCGQIEQDASCDKVMIEEGCYACFTHRGSLENIGTTLNYIWQSWMLKTKYTLRDAPDFEIYDHRFDQKTLNGEVDIWIPIESS